MANSGLSIESDLLHVLHVDADEAFLEISKEILKVEGKFNIDTVLSVDEAFKKLQSASFDVIVSDFEMPQKSGLDFLAELRSCGYNLPFILFTGRGREEIAIKVLNLGADGYINKQGNPETVYGELAHYINQLANKHKTEKRLLYEQNRLEKLSSQMFGALYQFKMSPDGSFSIPFSTVGIKEIYGCTAKDVEFDFTPIGKVIHPEDFTSLIESIKISAESLSPWFFEYRVQVPDKPLKWVLSKSIPEKQHDGSILWSGYSVDITEQKKTQKTIETETNLKSILMDNLPCVAMVLKNGTREIVASNKVAKQAGFVSGKQCFSFVTGSDDPCHFCLAPTLWETNTPQQLEVAYRNKFYHCMWMPYTKELYVHYLFDITEQKQTEIALRESEAKYRRLLDGMIDTAWVIDDECNIIDVNRSASELLGYTKKELLKMNLTDIDNNLKAEKIKNLVKTMPKDKIQVFETAHTTKNGDKIPVEISSSLVTYKGKQAILSIARNITERKKAKEELIKSETLQRAIIANSPIGIATTTLDSKILSANESFCQIIGYSEDELKKMSFKDFTHPDYIKDSVQSVEDLNSRKIPFFSLEKKYIKKDGTIIDGKVLVSLICDKNANPDLHLVELEDITKQKMIEEQLRVSEHRWVTTLSSIGDGVIATDVLGKVSFMNSVAEELTGWTLKEAANKPLSQVFNVINEQTRLPVQNPVAKVLLEGVVVGLANHTVLVRRDGTEVPIDDSGAPIRDYQGNITGVVLVFRDITKRKKTEETMILNKVLLDSLLVINKMSKATEKELLDFALEAITKVSQSKYGFIGMLNSDETVMTIHSWSKNAMKECKTAKKPINYPISHAGIWAEPLRQRKPVFIKDYNKTSLKKKGLPNGHVEIKNYLGVPIFENDTVVVMAAVANKAGAYTADDVLSISSVLNDMWRMIQRKNYEIEREKTLSKLSISNEKLNAVGSIIRHDVGNKLMTISNNIYLLKRKVNDNTDLATHFDSIDSAIASSQRLFEFSRQYSRIGVEELSNIDIGRCFDVVTPFFSKLNKIKVINDCRGVTVIADSLIEQVFYNLIENSLKYGGELTQIKLYCEKVGDKTFLIYEDNGKGIPFENKLKLFIEGYSTGNSTGLGLSLIRKIVEFYGWSITEQGIPNMGAKFIITIPNFHERK